MTRYVALLRGINVGGKTMVKMSELKACFEAGGYTDVRTYINSGNVLFATEKQDRDQLEQKLEEMVCAQFGSNIPIVVRSLGDIQQTIDNLPKSWHTNTDQKFNVCFLKTSIDSPEILNGLSIKDGIETLEYAPGVLYWSALTNDLTKSAMIKISTKPIYKQITVRNLNTTLKLYEIMKGSL